MDLGGSGAQASRFERRHRHRRAAHQSELHGKRERRQAGGLDAHRRTRARNRRHQRRAVAQYAVAAAASLATACRILAREKRHERRSLRVPRVGVGAKGMQHRVRRCDGERVAARCADIVSVPRATEHCTLARAERQHEPREARTTAAAAAAATAAAAAAGGVAPRDERSFAAHHSLEELEQLRPSLPRLRQTVHLRPSELQQRRALLRLPRNRVGAGVGSMGQGPGQGQGQEQGQG